ncbi:MAG: enoyl-CoA hydratase-related protein [Pseudomonadota bacterium]
MTRAPQTSSESKLDVGNDVNGQIKVTVIEGHATILICNTKRRNAISKAMWQAIAEAIHTCDADRDIRLISIRGAGGTFVSGADISEFTANRDNPEQARAYEAANGAAFAALRKARTPTLALIEGYCFGGGVGLAAACDLRFASSTARFAIPAAKLGLAYPLEGMRDLVWLIGPAATKKLFFTADPIDAIEAQAMRLVEDVVSENRFEEAAKEYADTLLSRAPLTQVAAKFAIGSVVGSVDESEARKAADVCFASHDYAEGRNAFLEHRAPVFKGH